MGGQFARFMLILLKRVIAKVDFRRKVDMELEIEEGLKRSF